MKKSLSVTAIALAVSAIPASAHPTGIPYSSRGECEAAYAESSKSDRERLSETFGVTQGEAQRGFRDLFLCEYDPNAEAWFIVFVGQF